MRKLWRFADERGFDWFSVSDHFQETPPQGGDGACFESVSTMATVAAETTRVRVGCLVFCVGYRHPGVLAKAVTTIDHISDGRADCGIGAGWDEVEFASYGLRFPPIREREDQLEEYAEVLRLLFDRRRADFTGALDQIAGDVAAVRKLGAAELLFDIQFSPGLKNLGDMLTRMQQLWQISKA